MKLEIKYIPEDKKEMQMVDSLAKKQIDRLEKSGKKYKADKSPVKGIVTVTSYHGGKQ